MFEEENVTLETPAFVRQEEDVLRRQAVHVDQERVEVRLGQIKRQICNATLFSVIVRLSHPAFSNYIIAMPALKPFLTGCKDQLTVLLEVRGTYIIISVV